MGETQPACGRASLYQLLKSWLGDRHFAAPQHFNRSDIEIEACHTISERCHTGRRDRSEMPKALDTDVHCRASRTHSFARRKSTVLTMPSLMVSFGFHPRARIFVVSRNMKGLSPIHPRSPPL